MTYRRTTEPNEKAQDAFRAANREIDAMLMRIKCFSDGHFETDPDAIHWGNVGTLQRYANLLRQITDSAFCEGEHAQ